MTTRVSLFFLAFAFAVAGCGGGDSASTANLDGIQDTELMQQASYLFGYQMGDTARSQLDSIIIADLDMSIMMAAVQEGLSGDSLRYEPAQVRRVSRVIDDTLLLRSLRLEAVEDTNARGFLDEINTNLAATDSFFTALEGTDGLQTTDSGLRYVVLQEGEGESAAEGDIAQVQINATLMNGGELRGMTTPPDQSVPLVIGNFSVEGLNEALETMKPGESRRLFIPPDLAFGVGGLPAPGADRVPPATAVILEVTLTDILDQAEAAAAAAGGTAPPAGVPAPVPAPAQ